MGRHGDCYRPSIGMTWDWHSCKGLTWNCHDGGVMGRPWLHGTGPWDAMEFPRFRYILMAGMSQGSPVGLSWLCGTARGCRETFTAPWDSYHSTAVECRGWYSRDLIAPPCDCRGFPPRYRHVIVMDSWHCYGLMALACLYDAAMGVTLNALGLSREAM